MGGNPPDPKEPTICWNVGIHHPRNGIVIEHGLRLKVHYSAFAIDGMVKVRVMVLPKGTESGRVWQQTIARAMQGRPKTYIAHDCY